MNEKIQVLVPLLPLIQQIFRYIAIALLLLLFSKPLVTLIRGVQDRILLGSAVELGPSGLKLGEAPKLSEKKLADADIEEILEEPLTEEAPTEEFAVEQSEAPTKGGGMQQATIFYGDRSEDAAKRMYYLIHAAEKISADRYNVVIRLGAQNPEALQKVDRVIYHLHESFQDPVREIREKNNDFEIRLSAWGQFMLYAEVYIEGRAVPLKMDRYLNF